VKFIADLINSLQGDPQMLLKRERGSLPGIALRHPQYPG
jgi:hypothetical protein